MSMRLKRSVSVVLIGMLLFYSLSWGERQARADVVEMAEVAVPVVTFGAAAGGAVAGALFVVGVMGALYLAQIAVDNGAAVDINWQGIQSAVNGVAAYAGGLVAGVGDVTKDMTVSVPGWLMDGLAREAVVVHPASVVAPTVGVQGLSVPSSWQWAWDNGVSWQGSTFQRVGTWVDGFGAAWDYMAQDDFAGSPGYVLYKWPGGDYSIQNWPSRVVAEGFSRTWWLVTPSGYVNPVRVDFVPSYYQVAKTDGTSIVTGVWYMGWIEGVTVNGNPVTFNVGSVDLSNPPADIPSALLDGFNVSAVGSVDQGQVVADYPSAPVPETLPLPDTVEVPIPGGWVRQLPDGTVEVDVPTIDMPESVPYEIPDWSHLEPGGPPPEEPPKREVKPPVPPWWWPSPEFPPQGPVPDIPQTPVEVPNPAPTEFPTPGPTPGPGELPTPLPMPEPEPGTNPEPWPYPNPGPGTNPLPPPSPKKVPIPWPTPTPIPWPGPNPQPTPPPGEQDDPWNHPIPVPTPEPNPSPEPEQQPIPSPDIATETTLQRVERELRDLFDPTLPVDWEPLRRVGVELTERFPFSLPWDVWRAIDAVQAEGKLPDLKGQFYDPVQHVPIPWEIAWPDWMDRFRTVVRWGLFFVFNVGLIYAVARLFRGAS